MEQNDNRLTNLFSPLKIRSLELKNRIVLSPMQQYSSEDGFANNWHLVHLGSRAVGGAGLILTESASVNAVGRATVNDLGIWKDEHIAKWIEINDFLHQQGSETGMQLAHFGSKGSKSHPNEGFQPISVEQGGWETVSSSERIPFPGMSKPRKLTTEEIAAIQNDFVQGAKRAVLAGFDVVEIHAAHGYLFHQFLSGLINDRADEYGGEFDNRVRFLRETVQKVRQAIPGSTPLLVRISAVDYVDEPDAWKIEDSIRLAIILEEEGVDMITASGGGFVWVDKSQLYEGYQLEFAEAIKKESNIVVGSVGGIKSAPFANEVVRSGKADLAVIGREFLRNPYFGIEAARDVNADIEIPWQYKRAF